MTSRKQKIPERGDRCDEWPHVQGGAVRLRSQMPSWTGPPDKDLVRWDPVQEAGPVFTSSVNVMFLKRLPAWILVHLKQPQQVRDLRDPESC